MSRVWKKFLGKFVEPLAYMAYGMFAIGLTMWSGTVVNQGTGIAVFFIMIVIPAFAYLIRDMWRDAKREVEWENRQLIRDIDVVAKIIEKERPDEYHRQLDKYRNFDSLKETE